MDINYNITSIIDILGLVQGVLLGIVILTESRFSKAKLFLGLFLITFSIELLNPILEDLNILAVKPSLLFLPFNFYYLTIPLFYLYVKHISNSPITGKRTFLVLLPGIMEFVCFTFLFLQSNDTKLDLYNSENFNNWLVVYILLSFPYLLYFGILTVIHIHKHKKNVENFYSNTEGKLLIWAKVVAIVLLLLGLLVFTTIFFDDGFYNRYNVYTVVSTLNVLFIFWVGITGIRQSKLFDRRSFPEITKDDEKDSIEPEYKTDNRQYLNLIKIIEGEKLFLEPNISLADVSKRMAMPQRNLSELVKENSNKNFNQFINYYRVEEAKRLLKNTSNDNLNMLGIAFESGFNSKASFYSVFKKFTTQTPNSFKNQQITQ